MIKIILYTLIVFSTLYGSYSKDDPASIALFVMSEEGYIDEKLHDTFWTAMRNEKMGIETEIMQEILVNQPKLQIMIWSSIKTSVLKGTPVMVSGLKEELTQFSFNPNVLTVVEKMLDAAAHQEYFMLANEKRVKFSVAMAEHFINIWNAAQRRGELLMMRSFSMKPTLYQLTPTLSVSLGYPVIQHPSSGFYGEHNISSLGFSHRISEKGYLFISESEERIHHNIFAGLSQCVDRIFKQLGYGAVTIQTGDDYSFGMAALPNESKHEVAMCKLIHDRLYMITASSDSKEKVLSLFDTFTKNLIISKGDKE